MFREAVKVNGSCVLFPRAQVGEDKVQSQEAASVLGDLNLANVHRKSTEACLEPLSLSW